MVTKSTCAQVGNRAETSFDLVFTGGVTRGTS